MSSASHGGSRVDRSSPSSRVSNMEQDQDLHTRMARLEESMKLVLVALNIGQVEPTRIAR